MEPRRARRWSPRWVIPLAALLAGVGVVFQALWRQARTEPPSVEARPDQPPPPDEVHPRLVVPPQAPVAAAAPEPVLTVVPPEPAPDPAVERARVAQQLRVRVTLLSQPSGAEVRWDGEVLGRTPLIVERPLDNAEHELVAEAPNGERRTVRHRVTGEWVERFDFGAR